MPQSNKFSDKKDKSQTKNNQNNVKSTFKIFSRNQTINIAKSKESAIASILTSSHKSSIIG